MKRIVFLLLLSLPLACVAQSHVAIGDSLAFGFQEQKFIDLLNSGKYDPAAFNTGFVDVMDNYIRLAAPTFKTVNFGCPGETTTTLLNGGCLFHNWLFVLPLHQNYPGITPQFFAAAQYLQAHPNEALLITVTIGANDILNVYSDCAHNATCVAQKLPGVTATASRNLAMTISVLRILSPFSTIVYTNVPDPYLFSDPASVPNFASFNAAMNAAATKSGAKVADWFTAQQQVDQTTFCALTFVCQGPLNDIHPTDLGYQVLALQTLQTL